jgi:pyruvate/2-oxoglutarate dehydrogenase complex dihydrolipoamide acyltransferase (E2) component
MCHGASYGRASSRSGSGLGLPDLEGGTFTVSTLGSYGIDFFTPVITVGQVAILGVPQRRLSHMLRQFELSWKPADLYP